MNVYYDSDIDDDNDITKSEEEEEDNDDTTSSRHVTTKTNTDEVVVCTYCNGNVVRGGKGTINMKYCDHVVHLSCGLRFLHVDSSCPVCTRAVVERSDRSLPLDLGDSITWSRTLNAVRERNVSIQRAEITKQEHMVPPNPVTELLSVVALKTGDYLHQLTAGRLGRTSDEAAAAVAEAAQMAEEQRHEITQSDARHIEVRTLIREKRSVAYIQDKAGVGVSDLLTHEITADMLIESGYNCEELHKTLGVTWTDWLNMGLTKAHLQHNSVVFHVDYLRTKMDVDAQKILRSFSDLDVNDIIAWSMSPEQLVVLGFDAPMLQAPPLVLDQYMVDSFGFTEAQWRDTMRLSPDSDLLVVDAAAAEELEQEPKVQEDVKQTRPDRKRVVKKKKEAVYA